MFASLPLREYSVDVIFFFLFSLNSSLTTIEICEHCSFFVLPFFFFHRPLALMGFARFIGYRYGLRSRRTLGVAIEKSLRSYWQNNKLFTVNRCAKWWYNGGGLEKCGEKRVKESYKKGVFANIKNNNWSICNSRNKISNDSYSSGKKKRKMKRLQSNIYWSTGQKKSFNGCNNKINIIKKQY